MKGRVQATVYSTNDLIWSLRPYLIPFSNLFSCTSLCLWLLLTEGYISAHSVYPWTRRKLPSFIASVLHWPCRRNSQPTIPRAPSPPHAKDSSCWAFRRRNTFSRPLEPYLRIREMSLPAPPVCHDVSPASLERLKPSPFVRHNGKPSCFSNVSAHSFPFLRVTRMSKLHYFMHQMPTSSRITTKQRRYAALVMALPAVVLTDKLVPQGRDQVAKLPILMRTETHNFGRSHQSPVRIFTPTVVNSALSSSTSIRMLQYFLPCAPHCHSIQRLVE